MALSEVTLPIAYFPDPTVGRPVFNGSIFVGQPDLDPEIPANQVQITLRQEDGTEVQVGQPVNTGAGGVPLYQGSPVQLLVDGNHSLKVLNNLNSQVYYVENVFNGTPVTSEQVDILVDSFDDARTGNWLGLNIVGTRSFHPAWEGTATGPRGGRAYHRDGTPGTPQTAYPRNNGFFDANGDGFRLAIGPTLNIDDVGAIGGNAVADSAACQNAMDLSLHIIVPRPSSPYIFANLVPNRGQVIEGASQYDGSTGNTSTFIGDGTNPVFLCGDGGTTALREITFKNIDGDGNTQNVIRGRTSPNMTIVDCHFGTTSATENVIDLNQCVRCSIVRNRLTAAGGGWALQAYNDCNGSDYSQNIITGGALGGAMNIGLCAAMTINDNVVETSLRGYWFGANSDLGNGNIDGLVFEGNYAEDCASPFSFGLNFTVSGLSGSGNFSGNTNLTVAADAVVKWGRVNNSTFTNNRFAVNAGEDVYQLHLIVTEGDQSDNVLGNDRITGTPANVYTLQGTEAANASVQRLIGAQNFYPFVSDLSTLNTVVFESGVITGDVGIAASAFNDFNPLGLGGRVTKVEVIEKQGTITSTLSVGTSSSSAELVNVDPETLSYTDGRATATLLNSSALVRSTESAVYRVVAGIGTGTFRVRITYRVS